MKVSLATKDHLNSLYQTLCFIKSHFAVILGLGLIAAFGRVIQLGGFGPIHTGLNIALEFAIESARILIFLYVLGLANIRTGATRIRHWFSRKSERKQLWATALHKSKGQWRSILLSISGFLIITTVINYLINALAYETCLYLALKRDGILVDSASEWTILLFAKNLSVIPFMLVFQAIFLLWITNRLVKKQEEQICA